VTKIKPEMTRQSILPLKKSLIAALGVTQAGLYLPPGVVCLSKNSTNDRREFDDGSEIVTGVS
jgi:hypothetical protein